MLRVRAPSLSPLFFKRWIFLIYLQSVLWGCVFFARMSILYSSPVIVLPDTIAKSIPMAPDAGFGDTLIHFPEWATKIQNFSQRSKCPANSVNQMCALRRLPKQKQSTFDLSWWETHYSIPRGVTYCEYNKNTPSFDTSAGATLPEYNSKT